MSKGETIMETIRVETSQGLKGTLRIPGDKSISHRAVLMGMIASGTSYVRGWLSAGDTEATLGAARELGVSITRDGDDLTIEGGLLKTPDKPLNFVNAGTGIRLAAGIMAGQTFTCILDGSEQLRRRPMKRIIAPLQMMGANIDGVDSRCPLTIRPSQLRGIRYEMSVASAQVKSALLLAGLFARGATAIIQPGPARDHTERMLQSMGADIVTDGDAIILTPNGQLNSLNLTVPGDFSSAAFLIVAGLIVPGSDISLEGVNLNPTRTGLVEALQAMGGDITVIETGLEAGEPVGTIVVRTSALSGIEIGGDLVVRMIDEFPVFMIAVLCAEGVTRVRDARELRVKETDRIAVMSQELRKLGASMLEHEDGFEIVGPQTLNGAVVDGHDDHRIAMSLTIAGLVAEGVTIVQDALCARDSFPGFGLALQKLGAPVRDGSVLSTDQ